MKFLLPVLLVFSLFASGLFQTVAQGSTVESWQVLLDPVFRETMQFTVWYALVSALLSVLIGSGLALLTYSPEKKHKERASRLWLSLPAITVAYLLILLASPSGILASLFPQTQSLGNFNMVRASNGAGIIMAAILKESAFVLLWVRSSLDRLDPRMVLTARMLGARPAQIFREILVPVILPGALIAGLMIFIYALGSWELPYILGPSNPQALSLMVLEAREHGDAIDRSRAAAALSVLALVSSVLAWLVLALEKKTR